MDDRRERIRHADQGSAPHEGQHIAGRDPVPSHTEFGLDREDLGADRKILIGR